MMPDADGSMFGTELSSWVTFPWYTQVCHGERERDCTVHQILQVSTSKLLKLSH